MFGTTRQCAWYEMRLKAAACEKHWVSGVCNNLTFVALIARCESSRPRVSACHAVGARRSCRCVRGCSVLSDGTRRRLARHLPTLVLERCTGGRAGETGRVKTGHAARVAEASHGAVHARLRARRTGFVASILARETWDARFVARAARQRVVLAGRTLFAFTGSAGSECAREARNAATGFVAGRSVFCLELAAGALDTDGRCRGHWETGAKAKARWGEL